MGNYTGNQGVYPSEIYTLELDDDLIGGANGTLNKHTKALADRTAYLHANKADVSALTTAVGELAAQIDLAKKGWVMKDAAKVLLIDGGVSLEGLSTIDGVALTAGDRVLRAVPGGHIYNGIWVATANAWARAADTLKPNTTIAISEGTTHSDKWYQLINNGTITTGTTVQNWADISTLMRVSADRVVTDSNNRFVNDTHLSFLQKAVLTPEVINFTINSGGVYADLTPSKTGVRMCVLQISNQAATSIGYSGNISMQVSIVVGDTNNVLVFSANDLNSSFVPKVTVNSNVSGVVTLSFNFSAYSGTTLAGKLIVY
jgi:hypothetical protein